MELPKQEEHTLKMWEKEGAFHASIRHRARQRPFVFFEGPPTANGRPGIHHVLVRAMKDAFLRYKTMRGYYVPRSAGWDTHGLPVELQVERELGFHNKQDIERYGIARFNAKAKASVWRYKDEWERLTDRIGFWIDQKHPYITYENRYIESVWGVLKYIAKYGLLEEDFKVVPWCFRCGTALSSHEVAQGYRNVTENSVFVKFRVKAHTDEWKNTSILAWTTTPWTLPGNVALAVGKNIDYVRVTGRKRKKGSDTWQDDGDYILARAALEKSSANSTPEYDFVFGEPTKSFKGSDLVGVSYEPLFSIPEIESEKSHRVYAADFVSTGEGTGVVHTAAMYGEDDYRLADAEEIPKVHTVSPEGRFLSFVPAGLAGRGVKERETEKAILDFLKKHNLLFAQRAYAHDYPFCWRCDTPLLYYATRSWFIRMSQLRGRLISENDTIQWVPSHLRQGRFGEWLREVKDWAISRERYWGTPLPVWRCAENPSHSEVIGSRKDLARRAPLKNRYIALRHGQATNNERRFVSCYPEVRRVKVTKQGRQQIVKVAKALKRRGVDLIFSSDLERTRETAIIVGKELGIVPTFDERIREIRVGAFNGRPIKEYTAFLGNERAHWEKRPKGGETWRDVRRRMLAFMKDCEKHFSGKTILVVSHGDPLFVLQGALLGFEEEEYFSRKLPYPKVGVLGDLRGAILPFDNTGAIDLHRPWVDEFAIRCASCTGVMRRVPDVLDVWLDSGAMPFAARNATSSLADPVPYPADFICEAIDQTRGWFYTLLALAVAMGKGTPYRTVLCTGHVLDRHGKKMSKSRGNVVDPWEMIGRYGADAVRWYFYTINQPGEPKRFDEHDLKKIQQRFLGTLWNAFIFWKTYSLKKIPNSQFSIPNSSKLSLLDRWALSRLSGTIEEVRRRMDDYDITAACRALETFVVDDLSNWYIRRSRDRLQRPENRQAHKALSVFLAYVLQEVAKLTASFVPFLSDAIFRELSGRSVHTENFPQQTARMRDIALEESMQEIREVVAGGLAVRKTSGIPVRQPLAAAAVVSEAVHEEAFASLVKEELNVKALRYVNTTRTPWPSAGEGNGWIALDTKLTDSLRQEGYVRDVFRAIQEMRKTAGLTPKDRILLRVHATGVFAELLEKSLATQRKALRAANVAPGPKRTHEHFLIEQELRLGGETIWLGLRKV